MTKRFLLAFVTLAVSVLCSSSFGKGDYLDQLVLRDYGDGRQFIVESEYRYADSRNTLWTVPKGTVVNGASIPEYLWSLVGGPWEGLYRNASVIHDYFFDRRQYDSDSVHWVFYDAMITSGVSAFKAKVMYYAVLRFNPRWKALELTKQPCPIKPQGYSRYNCYPVLADEAGATRIVYVLETPKFDEAELKTMAKLIESKDPSVEDLERLAKARRGY